MPKRQQQAESLDNCVALERSMKIADRLRPVCPPDKLPADWMRFSDAATSIDRSLGGIRRLAFSMEVYREIVSLHARLHVKKRLQRGPTLLLSFSFFILLFCNSFCSFTFCHPAHLRSYTCFLFHCFRDDVLYYFHVFFLLLFYSSHSLSLIECRMKSLLCKRNGVCFALS